MKNSIKVTAKQNHLITKLVEACDAREAKGLVKFDVYDMTRRMTTLLAIAQRTLNMEK